MGLVVTLGLTRKIWLRSCESSTSAVGSRSSLVIALNRMKPVQTPAEIIQSKTQSFLNCPLFLLKAGVFWLSLSIVQEGEASPHTSWTEVVTEPTLYLALFLGKPAAACFFSKVNFSVLTPIPCPFHPSLPQWHVEDPSHSARSAGGGLHLHTHTPLTQQSRSGLTVLPRHGVGTYQGN